MSTIRILINTLILSLFITGCSGNYKSSDDKYRPIGQPPIVTDNNLSN